MVSRRVDARTSRHDHRGSRPSGFGSRGQKPMNELLTRHSPSSLNLFCASPAMWVLERVLGKRQPVGVPAHRGAAVEAGVTHGLMNRDADPQEAIDIAQAKYRVLTALSPDPRREKYGET